MPEPLTLTPRTNYGKLREASIFKHEPKRKKNWSLRPDDPHTRSERQRLANEEFERRFRALLA